jgi:hypothetical protein
MRQHRCSARVSVRRRAFGAKRDGDPQPWPHGCAGPDGDGDPTSAEIADSILRVRDRFSVSRNKLETDRIKMVAEIVSNIRTLSKKEIMFVQTVIDDKCSKHRVPDANRDSAEDDDEDEDLISVDSDDVHRP